MLFFGYFTKLFKALVNIKQCFFICCVIFKIFPETR